MDLKTRFCPCCGSTDVFSRRTSPDGGCWGECRACGAEAVFQRAMPTLAEILSRKRPWPWSDVDLVALVRIAFDAGRKVERDLAEWNRAEQDDQPCEAQP